MDAIDVFIIPLRSSAELQQVMPNATTPDDAVKVTDGTRDKSSAQELLEAYKANLSELTEDGLDACRGRKASANGQNIRSAYMMVTKPSTASLGEPTPPDSGF